MNLNKAESALYLFGMANQMVEHELDRVEAEHGIDLKREHVRSIVSDQIYYPQIEEELRQEAAYMAPHYEMFYSIEKSIRTLIRDVLEEEMGEEWWSTDTIPDHIRRECENRMQREIDTGTTVRSEDPIDFSTFGELGKIIESNWNLFGGQFPSKKAVERVMANLNTLRGPIAHCSPLAEDEVVRLKLSIRDWFRLME